MNKFTVFAVLSLVSLSACTDASTAIRAAENVGLTEVEPTGYRWFGCGRDDDFATGFSAKNVRGDEVTGVVCSGIFKGATVRFD